jgi:hypothetical protein
MDFFDKIKCGRSLLGKRHGAGDDGTNANTCDPSAAVGPSGIATVVALRNLQPCAISLT